MIVIGIDVDATTKQLKGMFSQFNDSNVYPLFNHFQLLQFRSREKRRISDMVLETRVLELTRENAFLKAELCAIKEKFGLPSNQHFVDPDAVSISMPENGCRGRRNKLLNSIMSGNGYSGKPEIDQLMHNLNGYQLLNKWTNELDQKLLHFTSLLKV